MLIGTSISLNANERIRGRLMHLSPRSIDVQIIEPWTGIDSGLSIPYFSCWGRPPDMFFQCDGKITQHGVHAAERLLKELHDACTLFHTRWQELANVHAERLKLNALRQPSIDEERFRQARASLRSLLRKKALASVQYQRALSPLNKLMKQRIDVKFEALLALAKHVREQHGITIPLDTMQQLVVKFLR